MISLECPHCAAPLQRARISPDQIVNCEFCGGAFEVDDTAKPIKRAHGVERAPATALQQTEPASPQLMTKAALAGLTVAALMSLAIGVWRSKSPIAATFLSVIWSGLGQIHNGQMAIGLTLAAGQLLALAWLGPTVGWPLFVLIWSYSVCNAYACASAARAGRLPTWDLGLTPALVGGGFVAVMLYLVADAKRVGQAEEAEMLRITSHHHFHENGTAASGELKP